MPCEVYASLRTHKSTIAGKKVPFKRIVHPKISAAFHAITINGNLKLSKRIKKHRKSSIEVVLMTQRLYSKPSAVIQHLCFYGAFVSYVEAKASVCIHFFLFYFFKEPAPQTIFSHKGLEQNGV